MLKMTISSAIVKKLGSQNFKNFFSLLKELGRLCLNLH